tara:strand:+ start:685 stop:1293 length:609 start_codon:yes stop_codon:yes gene_type:complete
MGSDSMQILFATSNQGKLSEASGILGRIGYSITPLLVDGKPPIFIEPQSEKLEEVALEKLRQARQMVLGSELEECPILVEDSGIFIDNLDGFPGVFSSFVEKKIGLSGILSILSGQEDRGAEYRATCILGTKDGPLKSSGTCRGQISSEISGNFGFGYDPIFIPDGGGGRTFGQMSSEEKALLSHRGRALKALSEVIIPPSK